MDIGRDQVAQMTQDQKDALMYYSNGNGQAMNAYLRDGERGIGFLNSRFRAEVKEKTNDAVSALNDASMPVEIDAFRGGDIAELNTLFRQNPGARSDPSKLVGKTYKNKGMLSTTTEADYAMDYASPVGLPSGVMYHTKIQKGAKAVYLDALHGKEIENEVLVAPNRGFNITKSYYDNGGVLHVHMTGG